MQPLRTYMDLRILDILDHARSSNQFNQEWMDIRDREAWREDIERYATGYLAFEAAGNNAEYNIRCLAMPSTIEGMKKRVLDRLHFDPSHTISDEVLISFASRN